jgi:hypothetical protein
MIKLKFYAVNALFSSLIGMVVNVWAMFIWGWRYFTIYGLICSMVIGAIIGTVSLFFLFQVFLRLTQRPMFGFLSNFLVVAVLNIAGAMSGGIWSYQDFFNSMWFLAVIVSEILSFFLTYAWYRRMIFYKEKLELKKALLQNQGE